MMTKAEINAYVKKVKRDMASAHRRLKKSGQLQLDEPSNRWLNRRMAEIHDAVNQPGALGISEQEGRRQESLALQRAKEITRDNEAHPPSHQHIYGPGTLL